MRRELLRRIEALEGTYTIQGQQYSALQVRLALRLVLKYNLADPSSAPNSKANNAPSRRVAAMRHLRIFHSGVESFRRATGTEAELLAILAEHIGGDAIAA